jgi:hypothetical protein
MVFSITVTSNVAVAELPEESVAVQVTTVVPKGKKEPDGGSHVTIGEGSVSSVAVTVKSTLVLYAMVFHNSVP